MDYLEQVAKNRSQKCDYCGERPAVKYFNQVKKHCCSESILGCPSMEKHRPAKIQPYTRPDSMYRKALALIDNEKVQCHYCGQLAKYYASGKFICTRVAYDCPEYKNWLAERKAVNSKKRNITNFNRRKATLAKYGINIETQDIPTDPKEYTKFLTKVKNLTLKHGGTETITKMYEMDLRNILE